MMTEKATIKAQVHALPVNTANAQSILVLIDKKEWDIANLVKGLKSEKDSFFHHLYITSDEQIKEGDCYINTEPNNPYFNKIYKGLPLTLKLGYEGKGYKDKDYFKKWMRKIVATTDPELFYTDWEIAYTGSKPRKSKVRFPNKNMGKIRADFIEAFVREQGKITEVLLEMENVRVNKDLHVASDWFLQLKLRPDGTVIIHKFKERTYTREEVMTAILEYTAPNILSYSLEEYKRIGNDIKQWFNKTYPE